jgi:hypothetical protein
VAILKERRQGSLGSERRADGLFRGLGIERHLPAYLQRRREDGLLRGQDDGAVQGISSPELRGEGFFAARERQGSGAREEVGEDPMLPHGS